jgi:hypothetical protein
MPDSVYARLAEALRNDWSAHARPEQLPPPGDDWSVWLLLSGRRERLVTAFRHKGERSAQHFHWARAGQTRRIGVSPRPDPSRQHRDVGDLKSAGSWQCCDEVGEIEGGPSHAGEHDRAHALDDRHRCDTKPMQGPRRPYGLRANHAHDFIG